ncbi:glycosyltransferase, partial [Candidatus Curtissbacteria bacterium]|nr:glycosyltransferase [Candidatus Curtissbacteria bacterium]
MDISVIIVSYNCREVLGDCLSSLIIAIQGLKKEIFVVDNNSVDGTPRVVKEKFPQVRLIANQKNLGFSKANNQAIKKASGRYVLILNPDTKVMSDTLIKMIEFMDKNEDVVVSTCRVELPTGLLDRDCRRHFPTPWRAFCHFLGLSKIFAGSRIFDQYYMGYLGEDRQHEIDACAGAFMMVR